MKILFSFVGLISLITRISYSSVISENASGDEFVFAIDKDNQAQKVFIQTGYAENGMVEVVAGLEEGATIISEGARLVKENQPVQIIK